MITELSNPQAARIETLIDIVGKMPNTKAAFPLSLIAQFALKGSLSGKQWYWVDKLISEAATKPLTASTAPLGDVLGAFAKVTKPEAKRPRVFLACITDDEAEAIVTLEPAKATSKNAGWLYVYFREGVAVKKGQYVAKISPLGVLSHGALPQGCEIASVEAVLRAFAAQPIETLIASGKATSHCCNCGKHLTHPASVAMGIGSTCVHYLGVTDQWAALAKSLKGEGN